MTRCAKQKREKDAAFRERRLNGEQKEFVLDCLACRMSYSEIQGYLDEEFGIKHYRKSAITAYKNGHAEEIERRRAEWRKSLKLSKLPFVEQYERVARYGRYAKIEDHRKRYTHAADQMRRIAEETGDLKNVTDVNLGLQNATSSQLAAIVTGALDRLDPRGTGGDGSVGATPAETG